MNLLYFNLIFIQIFNNHIHHLFNLINHYLYLQETNNYQVKVLHFVVIKQIIAMI